MKTVAKELAYVSLLLAGIVIFSYAQSSTTPVIGVGGPTAKSIVLLAPTTGQTNYAQLSYPSQAKITRVSCATDAGTVTINFDIRSESTPNTAGSNVLSSALVCGTSSAFTTSIQNSLVLPNAPVNLQISAVSGTPNVLRIHVNANPQ
ncbi:MAG: hypothetical protein KGI66_01055 [Patescibacteria group bacterium]|nr:hypothetical protein [Patescibacteria group bacterium]